MQGGENHGGQDRGMLPTCGDTVLEFNCRITSPSPYQVKENIFIYRENKIISQGLYSYDYTLFTAQTLIEKKTLSCKNISIICLFKSSDFKVEDKAWLDYPVLCTVFQIKVHIFLVTRRWRWAKEKKKILFASSVYFLMVGTPAHPHL